MNPFWKTMNMKRLKHFEMANLKKGDLVGFQKINSNHHFGLFVKETYVEKDKTVIYFEDGSIVKVYDISSTDNFVAHIKYDGFSCWKHKDYGFDKCGSSYDTSLLFI